MSEVKKATPEFILFLHLEINAMHASELSPSISELQNRSFKETNNNQYYRPSQMLGKGYFLYHYRNINKVLILKDDKSLVEINTIISKRVLCVTAYVGKRTVLIWHSS